MKIKLTTENKLGLSKEVLSLLSKSDIDLKKVEVETGLIHIETENIEKTTEGIIASKLMKINGVNWVESISVMPTQERNLFLSSLLNAINDPVFAINNKGVISYQNNKAKNCFNISKNTNLKEVFTDADWASVIDTAAKENIAVNINTIAGSMLVEVRPTHKTDNTPIGAVLVFHQPENITARSNIIKSADITGFNNMIAENPNMLDLIKRAKHMSNTNIPLMIYGESGVGKKTLAQSIHHSSDRKNHMFSCIDCSSIKPSQIEIELYGLANPTHGKAGILEISDGGTVFIESIQELPEDCQLKLLDFIQNNYFYRANGNIKKQVNLKIIATSPMPLKAYADNHQFNTELSYALDITHLLIPPLRERKEDIEPLIQHFLNQFKSEGGTKIDSLSFEALNKIKSYYWPGNLTQLKNLLFKACLIAKETIIHSHEVEIEGHVHVETSLDNRTLPEAVAEFEKHFLQHWYQKHTSTRKLAAHLGVSHTTIAQKLNKYSIN